MATTLIDYPTSQFPIPTSSIGSISAHTDLDKVDVSIVRDPDGDFDRFFSTTLYSFNGIVTLSDIGSLLETRMRAVGLIWNMFDIYIGGELVEFTALYCECILHPDFDCTSCFLSASGSALIHRNSAVSLSHWDSGSLSYTVKFVGHDINGNVAMVEREFSRRISNGVVSFMVNDILKLADSLADIAYFAICYGDIQKIFYLVDDPFFITFRFRNMFNAVEYLDVVGTVTQKTEVSRHDSICSGILMQYDQVSTRTYEVRTGALTADQIRDLEQLISSRSIVLCVGDESDSPVIITDHTFEVDNADDSLNSVKFTFRFSDRRPRFVGTDMGALRPLPSHVFTDEFTAEFS